MSTLQNTPGFNCHIFISFGIDRNGRRLAFRRGPLGMRRFRMPLITAENLIAQQTATEEHWPWPTRGI